MFKDLKTAVARRFNEMARTQPLLAVDHDRDAIWAAYIEGFPEASRQEHQCSACRAFIRQAGNAVTIDPATLELRTVWDVEAPPEYAAAMAALRAYVASRPIVGIWTHDNPSVGVDRNPDAKRGVVWEHFHAAVPAVHQTARAKGKLARAAASEASARKSADLRDTANVLKRSVEEITSGALDTVSELVAQGSLYRGNDYRAQLDFLKSAKSRYASTEPRLRGNLVWLMATTATAAVARVRNTAVGTLLVDLSEGRDLEDAVSAFERMVAPTNYKRPTSLVTPRMVEAAKERMTELGLLASLERKRLDTRDIPASAALFVHRPKPRAQDVFTELAGDQPVDVKKLSKVEEVSAKDFVDKVLPTAKSIRVLFERDHLGNLVTLTGPQDPTAPGLFKWDNPFGWSYTGGVADSIKERVKAAGGNVAGWMRASLSWHNHDDLDLHLREEKSRGGEHVYFGARRSEKLKAELDVDMNAGGRMSREPVENIHVARQLPEGDYVVYVNNFARRESHDAGYDLEIEVNGETMRFGSPTSPGQSQNSPLVRFKVTKDGSVAFEDTTLSKTSSGTVKWGLKTGQWHTVRAVSVSPNHWTRPTGNRHLFFMLEGCVSDERTRPFYNEFLREDLAADRKVTEVLGSKLEVSPAEGAELSGVGFSDTIRNHVYVEVEGAFKRVVKINF